MQTLPRGHSPAGHSLLWTHAHLPVTVSLSTVKCTLASTPRGASKTTFPTATFCRAWGSGETEPWAPCPWILVAKTPTTDITRDGRIQKQAQACSDAEKADSPLCPDAWLLLEAGQDASRF